MLAQTQLRAARCAGPSRARQITVRAFATEAASKLADGTKVKVVKHVKVYHAPRQADGLDLHGMEGVITKNVTIYKGKQLSANLPYQIQFQVERDGKPAKLICHLAEDELDVVA